jgi:hypothetical protein
VIALGAKPALPDEYFDVTTGIAGGYEIGHRVLRVDKACKYPHDHRHLHPL